MVERIHGKDEVRSSILRGGSNNPERDFVLPQQFAFMQIAAESKGGALLEKLSVMFFQRRARVGGSCEQSELET